MPFDANDPDTKKALKEAIAAALEEAAEAAATELEKVTSKNKELIAEVREARKGKNVDPAELERLETERDEWKTKATTAEKAAKAATTAAEKATKDLATEQGTTQKLLVENGLKDALIAAGVTSAVHQKAVRAMMAPDVEIVTEGDQRVAKVGGKSLSDHVKEWAASDEGKHFVAAPNNTGGNAPGGKVGATGKTMGRPQFDAMDHGARSAFMKEGGTVVDQAA